MAGSRKKVILRTLTRALHFGYLPPSGLLDDIAAVSLLDLDARILSVPLAEVLTIAYVRDFNREDPLDPERLNRRTFLARPRTEGLWLRLTMHHGDLLEGLAPLDASFADSLLEDRGLYLTPPDTRSNTQRLFVPRTAFTALQVVAVITNPSRQPRPQPSRTQTSLFP